MIITKLRQTNLQSDIAAAQIVGMSAKHITVKTEDGKIVNLPLSDNNRQDQVFLASLRDIWRNKIWIPVNIKFRQLFQYDWLTEPAKLDH